jgi:hypothetical protein
MATIPLTLRDKVLEAVQTDAIRPTDLLKLLETDGVRSREVENALSELLDSGSVRFEFDGRLHASPEA